MPSEGIGGRSVADALGQLEPMQRPDVRITREEREDRIARAALLVDQHRGDAILILAGASLRYFTGLSWGPSERLIALLVCPGRRPILIAPVFEEGSLTPEVAIDCELRLWQEDEDPIALAAVSLNELGIASLLIDPTLSFGFTQRLAAAAPDIRLSDGAPVIDGCRMCKSPSELALMRHAKAITLEVQRQAASILVEGMRASAVKTFIDQAHRRLGPSGSTFCTVHFGASTAFPHGTPQDDVLRPGDMVLIDTGCTVDGYHSDITRSYVFGDPTAQQREMWALEQRAQQAAFDAVRPGVPCAAIDQAARDVLEAGGLGPDYRLPGLPHRTGHGIGLSIHEPPYLVRGETTLLEPGMCCSNEPMIVVPGQFGIRLEDHFRVTETGAAWFTEPSPSIDQPFR